MDRLYKEHTDRPQMPDLGDVAATADVRFHGRKAGQVIALPWQVRLDDLAREGKDMIEIQMAHTLARHDDTYTPTAYVFESQTESGLLSPVPVRAVSDMRLRPAVAGN